MRVVLPDTYFDGNVASAELQAILLTCAEGPHLLETEPLADVDDFGAPVPPPKFRAWLQGQGATCVEIAKAALIMGLRWSFDFQPQRVIRLHADQNTWKHTCLKLQPAVALRLLRLPLQVVIEDAVNDAHFLRAVTRVELRAALAEAEEHLWLEFSHGGGLTSGPRLLRSWIKNPLTKVRKLLIFDSDARVAGTPSHESEILRKLCVLEKIPHHQLKRRSIENYLPLPALRQWAHSNLSPRPDHGDPKRMVMALEQLPLPTRYHYNYKNGQSQDRKGGNQDATTIWDRDVPAAVRAELESGLHPTIASLFAPAPDRPMKPNWIETDDVDKEMFGLIRTILAYI